MSNNSESWNLPNTISFFDNHPKTTVYFYPSEIIFLTIASLKNNN